MGDREESEGRSPGGCRPTMGQSVLDNVGSLQFRAALRQLGTRVAGRISLILAAMELLVGDYAFTLGVSCELVENISGYDGTESSWFRGNYIHDRHAKLGGYCNSTC